MSEERADQRSDDEAVPRQGPAPGPAPGEIPVDVEAKLHELETLVAEAKTVPLSASVMVNRVDLEGIVEDLRASFPEEMRQARWILKERQEVIDRARKEAEQIRQDTAAERERLVSRTEVVQAANREADRIIDDAHDNARQIRLEAEDYVDAKLANFEVVLQKTLAAVERGREKLRGRLDVDELAEPEGGLDSELDGPAVETQGGESPAVRDAQRQIEDEEEAT